MPKAYVGEATSETINTDGKVVDMPVPGVSSIRRFWAWAHNSVIIALLFTLIGIGVGVKVSHKFYVEKISEVVQTGAMLHNKKVYTIVPKL